jgi:hypothetical protein
VLALVLRRSNLREMSSAEVLDRMICVELTMSTRDINRVKRPLRVGIQACAPIVDILIHSQVIREVKIILMTPECICHEEQ